MEYHTINSKSVSFSLEDVEKLISLPKDNTKLDPYNRSKINDLFSSMEINKKYEIKEAIKLIENNILRIKKVHTHLKANENMLKEIKGNE